MTTDLQIKDVARSSGFTTATLRYYEQIGLLPATSRSPAGYRLYDQRALDRLAFIARAKQLGCSLDEIAALTAAWEGGKCGPVQDQLRQLVAGKIEAAQHQIAALMTFTAELQQAAADLERHRPDGACDAECGCVSTPAADGPDAASVAPRAVRLTRKPTSTGELAIACTLTADAMQGRLDEWHALLARVERRVPVAGGVRCEFDAAAPLADLVRLVAAEQQCCQFFEFAITLDTRGVALEVRAPDDAREIVETMFGRPS